ncbi:MAG: hypothetical protein ACOYOU_21415 [Kiritimatiellia bacterium]
MQWLYRAVCQAILGVATTLGHWWQTWIRAQTYFQDTPRTRAQQAATAKRFVRGLAPSIGIS